MHRGVGTVWSLMKLYKFATSWRGRSNGLNIIYPWRIIFDYLRRCSRVRYVPLLEGMQPCGPPVGQPPHSGVFRGSIQMRIHSKWDLYCTVLVISVIQSYILPRSVTTWVIIYHYICSTNHKLSILLLRDHSLQDIGLR